jgi:hypothetical protein
MEVRPATKLTVTLSLVFASVLVIPTVTVIMLLEVAIVKPMVFAENAPATLIVVY